MPVSERLACQIGHYVEEEAIGFPGIMERQDVRVGQIRGDLNFREETLGSDNGSQFRPQDLEGHLAAVLDVVGEVDLGHPAFTYLTLDGVAAFEGGVQAGDGVRHGGQNATEAYRAEGLARMSRRTTVRSPSGVGTCRCAGCTRDTRHQTPLCQRT